MIRKNTILCFILCLYGMCFPGQQNINTDDVIRKAQMRIYDNPDETIRKALELLDNKQNSTRQKTSIYLLLSNAYISKRNFDESLKYILLAKNLINDTNDKATKANILISIAIQYQQMELFNKCFETLDEAENYYKTLGNTQRASFEAKNYALRGMIYKSQSNTDIALEKFLVSLKYFEKTQSSKPNFANRSIVLYNIGYCYIDMNQLTNARSYFEISAEYSEKAQAKSLEAFALKGLAETYTLQGNNSKALELLLKAEKLSKNIGDLVLDEGIYMLMANNYLALNEPKKYQYYNQKYIENRFEREQSELKSINTSINNQTAENMSSIRVMTHHHRLANIIISISGICIAVWLLKKILKRKRQNKTLQNHIKNLLKEH